MTVEHAIRAATRGWHVFPVLPDTKRPVITDWPSRAIGDPVRVGEQWPAGYNIGIATEPSGLVVVDLDVGKPLPPSWRGKPGTNDGLDVFTTLADQVGADWPDTHMVRTPRGGLHLYFFAPSDGKPIRNSQGDERRPLIDVRAAGGYVVAAGSVIGGRPYEELGGAVAVLPDWLAALLGGTSETGSTPRLAAPPPSRVAAPDRYVATAFENEIQAVATAWEGARNAQLNKSAFALARFVAAGQLDRDTVIGALTRAGEHIGLAQAEIRRTLRSAFVARGAA